MKRVLLLLVLVTAGAMAEEEIVESERTFLGLDVLAGGPLGMLASGLGAAFEVAVQIVILVALVLLISTLKNSTGGVFSSSGYDSGSGYEYYEAPAHATAYDTGSGSSYASGYSKRSADSLLDIPVIQKLTERVHNAVENFSQ